MKTKVFSLMLILAAFVFVTSCSKDDDDEVLKPTLNKTNIVLYVDETETLIYSTGDCKWSSDNVLVADVENGIVSAKHVGTTTIHANDLTCEVTVKPKYTSYTEPLQEWGSSKSQVKSLMSGFTLKGENDTSLGYIGKGKVIGYVYQFENGVLIGSAFSVSLLNSVGLTDYLLERYWVIDIEDKGSNNFYAYLGTTDLKTYVVYNLTTNGSTVMYIPADRIKSSSKTEIKAQLRKRVQRI